MELAGNTFFWEWEVSLMVWLQARMGTIGAAAASMMTMLGEEMACIVVLGFLYWCYDKEFGKYIGRNILIATVLNPMIKNVFLRRRPYFDHPQIACLKPVKANADLYDIAAQGYSFPSGHSTNSVVIFSSLSRYRRNRWLTVIGVVIPLLVGISRFCLGVHYPTDVIAGWLLGILIIYAVPYLSKKIPDRRLFYGLMVLAAIPGVFYCRSNDYFTGFGMLLGYIAAEAFEERYVKFENTRSPLHCVLRLAGGMIIFLVLNKVLKMPFSTAFLESGTMAAYAVRSVRYALLIFVEIGLYPAVFARFHI